MFVIIGYLRYFLKTKVIVIGLFEREYHMQETFSELGYPGNAFVAVGDTDHGFGGVDGYWGNFLVFGNKMVEKRY